MVGGIYGGGGGGSLLSPILVGLGLPVSTVAPAALTSTSLPPRGRHRLQRLGRHQPNLDIAPDWMVGLIAGAGGLIGGYLGAALQPLMPERVLRAALGVCAITTAIFYTAQTFT